MASLYSHCTHISKINLSQNYIEIIFFFLILIHEHKRRKKNNKNEEYDMENRNRQTREREKCLFVFCTMKQTTSERKHIIDVRSSSLTRFRRPRNRKKKNGSIIVRSSSLCFTRISFGDTYCNMNLRRTIID